MALDRDVPIDRLRQDLIGPEKMDEVLHDRPSDVYLTGILWPRETRMGSEDIDQLGAGGDEAEDSGEEEEAPLVSSMRPCVAGLSFALTGSQRIKVVVQAGLYEIVEKDEGKPDWKRRQVRVEVDGIDCSVPFDNKKIPGKVLPAGIHLSVRSAPWPEGKGRLVTVTLVNEAVPAQKNRRSAIEVITLFQTSVTIWPEQGTEFLSRPDRKVAIDADDHSAALLYRQAHEYAVGHTCSATWADPKDGTVEWVATEWMPQATVAAVRAEGHAVFDSLNDAEIRSLDAEWLSQADDKQLETALLRLPAAYRLWLKSQSELIPGLETNDFRAAAASNIAACEAVASRLEAGARQIARDPNLAAAFRLANRAMLEQALWAKRDSLQWRPFQLGFFLLAAVSAIDEADAHRTTMDLLWFPTGGGKTEAYLGVIAFLAFARRLRSKGGGAGVAAIMRYTLRLLTTQQFSRASALILSCEAIRRGKVKCRDDVKGLGKQPFGIGLWVGGSATPNTVALAARALGGDGEATPRQLIDCPACGDALEWYARPRTSPVAIEVRCANKACKLFDASAPLPIHTVDEDIYRERPTLLIGTVDKFAQIVRRPECGFLFDVGKADTPDLIIQDELHLISGPLGTMVGLYEAGIDRLMWRGKRPPKVIGSTATIRRAEEQVNALFARKVCQFPPPALNAEDSGFAVVDLTKTGRLYVAVTTAGRSAKFTLQAVSGSLLQTGLAGFPDDATRDPYWSLVTYFNSLRELGGAFVLMQDDVPNSIRLFAARRNEEARKAFAIEELTSRRSQAEVRDMLDIMDVHAGADGALDALLASNMLSVGVDIQRLGLMVVNGQPKGISEYIQATSRVGRRHPGVVVVILNNAKARDRSHFETFRTWHSTLYRDVEATSVTPFAPRARDRALHAALLAAARHLVPGLEADPRLGLQQLGAIDALIDDIVQRAAVVDAAETGVRAELKSFVLRWQARRAREWWNDFKPGGSLLISAEAAAARRAQGRDDKGAQSTPNSMRNVEPGVPFRMTTRLAGNQNNG